MKLIQITAGTGSYYCGNCIRDNSLVLALRRLGHDALMVPLYLPTIPDDTSAAGETPIFLGGINIYLQQKLPLFRWTPRWIDSFFDQRSMLKKAAQKAEMTRATDLGEMTLATIQGHDGPQRKEVRRIAQWLKEEQKPEAISMSNMLLTGMAVHLKRELDIPVICTMQGEDSFLDHLPEPYRQQCWDTLKQVCTEIDSFVGVSEYYAGVMKSRLDLPDDKVHVIHNGISLNGFSSPPKPKQPPPVLGYLSRMHRDKGFDTIVDAFIELKKRIPALQLKVVGVVTGNDPKFVEEQKQKLERHGFLNDASFHANVSREEKIRHLESFHVMSVPAMYGEAFGLYILEAHAAGVPVVQPRHAAFPEVLEATKGGLLYDDGTPSALADALASLLENPEQARVLGEAGRRSVEERFQEEHMATNVVSLIEHLKGTHEPVKTGMDHGT